MNNGIWHPRSAAAGADADADADAAAPCLTAADGSGAASPGPGPAPLPPPPALPALSATEWLRRALLAERLHHEGDALAAYQVTGGWGGVCAFWGCRSQDG